MKSVDELLEGGGHSAKFPTLGTTVKGKVLRTASSQQTDMKTKEPKTYKNGDPMMQIIVTLQTDERDPEDADDTGERNLYVKGNMLNAVREALRKAHSKLVVGGTLAVKWQSEGEPPEKGFNPPKLYVSEYKAPVADQTDASIDSLI